jgi:hypothetical protein
LIIVMRCFIVFQIPHKRTFLSIQFRE